MLSEQQIQNHLKAGKIASEALQYGKSLIKPGAKVISVLDAVEEKIIEMGGEMAFPAQISLDNFAAHSCSDLGDETVLDKHVVKLDVGVHIDGYIADNALTVDLSGKYEDLVKASREALNNALKIVKVGVELKEIGKVIEDTIKSYGFEPVRNLSGHGLGLFQIHTKPSIPNFDNGSTYKLKEGDVIAIEPFASTGAGMVKDEGEPTVFTLKSQAAVRDPITRGVQNEIKKYNGLPFAKRWLEKKFGTRKVDFALRRLAMTGHLVIHKPLSDVGNGIVSQAEHSVIVGEEVVVFTRD